MVVDPMGSCGLAFQLVACHPWVIVDDTSLTDPMNQSVVWLFGLYTFYSLSRLLNTGNHDES